METNQRQNYQQIRVKVNLAGATTQNPVIVRYNAQTKKDYKYVKGLYVSMPHESLHAGSFITMKIGQIDLFDQDHETKLLACGYNVAPNDMFFRIGCNIEAAGSEVEGKLTFTRDYYNSEIEVIIYLLLSDEAD